MTGTHRVAVIFPALGNARLLSIAPYLAKVVNSVRVHPKVREQAILALDRMLSLVSAGPVAVKAGAKHGEPALQD